MHMVQQAKHRIDVYMSYGWGSTGENVTSERKKTWHQTSECKTKKRFVKWLLHMNVHPAARISQYDNSHPVPIRCFWILLEFCNTTVRVRSRVIRER